jgi:Protein of unknown function (DUF3551)
MRILALAILATLAIGTILAAAQAQTYDPNYPVCLHRSGPVSYFECNYTSLPQCAASASGLPAQCVLNPYFANANERSPAPRHRRRAH